MRPTNNAARRALRLLVVTGLADSTRSSAAQLVDQRLYQKLRCRAAPLCLQFELLCPYLFDSSWLDRTAAPSRLTTVTRTRCWRLLSVRSNRWLRHGFDDHDAVTVEARL